MIFFNAKIDTEIMLDIGTHTDDPNSNFDESNPDLKQLAILETIYEIP